MPTYRNRNTGQVVEYERPRARLEMLPNWDRLPDPEQGPEQEREATPGEALPEAPESAYPADSEPLEPAPPGVRATKAEWADYARRRGCEDPDTMTKSELIERYGGG